MPVSVGSWYGVKTDGNDTTYAQCLTHRYVSGQLRFLYLTLGGTLHEFALPSPGATQTTTTGTWDIAVSGTLGNVLSDHVGIWWEEAASRLWVTKSRDYTTTYYPAFISLLSLGAGGAVTVLKQFSLDVPAKRVYGGARKVPASLVSAIGGSYVVGWGGYTSLLLAGGGAAIGPTMYAIPDPSGISDGATDVATVTVLDAFSSRGYRESLPVNYFDGGDTRTNPSTRPTVPPDPGGSFLSPNGAGKGWMIWGDSYYNTGNFIGTRFVSIASLCGIHGATETVVGSTTLSGYTGAGWYQSSTLAYDGRQFELHAWETPGAIADPLTRPDVMEGVGLPKGNSTVWQGNAPTGNVAGATYDESTDTLWAFAPAFGDVFTARLFPLTVTFDGEGGNPVAFMFNAGMQGLADASIDFGADTIRARLALTSETPDEDAAVMTGIGVTGNDQTLTTKTGPTQDDTNDRITYGADDVVFGSQGAGAEVNKMIIFKFVTNDADSIPIASVDITPITPSGSDITVTLAGGLLFFVNNQVA